MSASDSAVIVSATSLSTSPATASIPLERSPQQEHPFARLLILLNLLDRHSLRQRLGRTFPDQIIGRPALGDAQVHLESVADLDMPLGRRNKGVGDDRENRGEWEAAGNGCWLARGRELVAEVDLGA